MTRKFFGAAVTISFALLTFSAKQALAQDPVTLATTTPISLATARTKTPLPGHSLVVVRVLDTSGAPLKPQAMVQFWSDGTPSVYKLTDDGSQAAFEGTQSRRYSVKASAAGYEPAEKSLETYRDDTFYQVILKLKLQSSSPKAAIEASSHLEAISLSFHEDGEKDSGAWRPPKIDQENVAVADSVTCPVAKVLDGAMERVGEFVENVNRFAATEQVAHQDLNRNGKVISTERRKFDYVASIEQLPSGDFGVDESRNGSESYGEFPAQIATLGLPTLVFVFHERYRSDYQFDCKGLGELDNQAMWIVDFQQREGRPGRIRGYDVRGVLHPVSLRGRAWIAADTLQIVRMEADIANPIPEIKLRDEHQTIQYRRVHFQTTDADLWLPSSADLYFDFRNHKYHRVHTFTSYLLFSVSATEKIGLPKELASAK